MTPVASRILVVDDEANIRGALVKLLAKEGYEVRAAASVPEALAAMQSAPFDIVLTDLKMPGEDGIQLLRGVKKQDSTIEVIVMTAYGTVETAVKAMRKGAYDYIEKPLNMERLPIILARAIERRALAAENIRLRTLVSAREEYGNLVGRSEKITKLYEMIEMVAPTSATVLIQGESGAGKELIARALHLRGSRAAGPMISLNCGAIPESLLESELFGFEKGAFTGADSARQGKIEMADKGTLFLDEVAEMNPKTQIELLRVLEARELRRLGGSRVISVDIRVIAATNKILSEEVTAGRFREDLYYRLNVVPIKVPPLRERTEDIPILIRRFLEEFGKSYHKAPKRLSREAAEALLHHRWPGNVRELRNLMERLTVTVNDTLVRLDDLPEEYRPRDRVLPTMSIPLGVTLEKVEEAVIRRTLSDVTSHRERAAAILGISARSLHYKLRGYGISENDDEPPASS